MITLTREAWAKFAPGCPPAYTDALFAGISDLQSSGILETELRWCHFAATVYEETGDFKEIRENLSYRTCKALRATWPSRFGHMSEAELKPLLKNPQGLAEKVYGGRMGNRPGTSDAYDYRGGGWFNTTGVDAVRSYCGKLGLEPSPSILDNPVATLRFAVLEWTETQCNTFADQNDIRKVAKAINTGSANSNVQPVGMDDRKRAFARAWKIWGETGTAESPTSLDDVTRAAAGTLAKYAIPATGVGAGTIHVASQGVPQVPDVVSQGIASAQAWQVVGQQVADLWGFVVAKPMLSLPLVGMMVLVGWVLPYFARRNSDA